MQQMHRRHLPASNAVLRITAGQATASARVALCSLRVARQDWTKKCPSPYLHSFGSTVPGYLRLQAVVSWDAAKSLDLQVPDLH